MAQIAVLTGDLIASTRHPEAVERAMLALSKAARSLSDWTGHDTRFTRFRGDGWQIYLGDPRLTLRAALFVTAWLRAADPGLATRLSIAVAPHGAPLDSLGPEGLNAATGAAFVLSGRNLDHLSASRRTWAYAAPDHASQAWEQAVVDLALWQAQHWTREQAEVVAMALTPAAPTQDQMAQSLGITRQAVQARMKGAGLSAMTAALAAFEDQTFGGQTFQGQT